MQRTAPWVLPKPDGEFTPTESTLFEKIPLIQKLNRDFIYYLNEAQVVGMMYNDNILKLGEVIGKRHINKYIRIIFTINSCKFTLFTWNQHINMANLYVIFISIIIYS